MRHVRSFVDDLNNERRHVSERVGLSYEPLSVIGCSGFEGVVHLHAATYGWHAGKS